MTAKYTEGRLGEGVCTYTTRGVGNQSTAHRAPEHGTRITEDMVHTHRTTWPHGSHFDGTRGHSMAATRSENPARVRGWESDTFS